MRSNSDSVYLTVARSIAPEYAIGARCPILSIGRENRLTDLDGVAKTFKFMGIQTGMAGILTELAEGFLDLLVASLFACRVSEAI
jgi:hypothetical protein